MSAPRGLICMSPFKGTLTNVEACEAVSRALQDKGIANHVLPIGDGGSGTLHAVQGALGGEIATFSVSGPLGPKVQARVLCFPNASHPSSLYVESSEACGHSLIGPEMRRDAMRASSHGLGEILKMAEERWNRTLSRIYVGLGDSAVSDMGMGMLHALGYAFTDHGGKPLWGNAESLRQMRSFDPPAKFAWEKIKVTVLCDVLNPLLGPQGCARTFSPQKGATPGQVGLIEAGMENFVSILEKTGGHAPRHEPMTGAAGGLGAAFLAFFDAELVHGARFLMDWIQFDRWLSEATFVVVGEGRTDFQTLSGKAPVEIIDRAARAGKPSLIVSGSLGEGWEALTRYAGVAGCFASGSEPSPMEALARAVNSALAEEGLLAQLTTPLKPISADQI